MLPTNLYEISSAINAILSKEEWDDAAIAELDALNLALEAKASNIVHFCANLEAFAAAAKAEEQRIAGRRKAAEGRIERLKGYIKAAMESADRTELDAGTHHLRIQNNPPAVVVDDETAIPPRFFTISPQTTVLDKKTLAQELKKGPVDGAHLEQGKSLRIS